MVDYFKSFVLTSRNVILNGAIGTGKTLLAKELAEAITGDTDKLNHPHWELMVFTPSTCYEDFMEGLRPVRDVKGNIGSERKDGPFKAFCKKALNDPEQNYVFIIDNINHCNLTEVFGELVYAIEPALRGVEGKVRTRYQYLDEEGEFKDGFFVPENVFIIGTMNEIDHSAVPMDYSMRRRFAFKEVTAVSRIDMWDGNIDNLKDVALSKMNAINAAIEQIPGLNSAYHIGPSYFLKIQDLHGDWSELWHSTLIGLVAEYLRGMPDAQERMQEVVDAYNMA
ncbi:MAG: AAA family ATPase [Bacteroidaceae bacterium]|nr:AAA family ATPase [Bacteroidaceae bacterium]